MCIVTAFQHIGPDEVILACPLDDTQNQPSIQIVGQFDGSSQREERIGGAGYVVYAIEDGQSRVIACRAVALPRCSDNIEAEILACLFLVEEVSIVVKQLLAELFFWPAPVAFRRVTTWGLPVDQRGIEPPPAACPRRQERRPTNWAAGTPQTTPRRARHIPQSCHSRWYPSCYQILSICGSPSQSRHEPTPGMYPHDC